MSLKTFINKYETIERVVFYCPLF